MIGVPDFGFPGDYIEYRTSQRVGSGGVQPLVAFQPLPTPNGSESEGSAGVAFAPTGFPAGLTNGIFVGFHGQSSLAGGANDENPVVFYDLGTGEYFHFIENRQASVGHLDTFLSTSDSLFVADLSSTGGFGSSGTGVIYQVQHRPSVRCRLCRDVDADGTADLLWRDTSGLIAIWLMNGAGAGTLGTVTADWHIQ